MADGQTRSRQHMSPHKRAALAKRLRQRANSQPGLTPEDRKEARRHASNLENLNKHQKS